MKNPFLKTNNNTLITSVAIGSAVAGAATYFFTTEKGAEMRRQIADTISGWFRKKEVQEVDHTAYLKKPHKEPKSDRQEILAHGQIIEQPGI